MDPHRHLQLELGAAARTGQWAPGCLALWANADTDPALGRYAESNAVSEAHLLETCIFPIDKMLFMRLLRRA
jgi:hypothetical protein